MRRGAKWGLAILHTRSLFIIIDGKKILKISIVRLSMLYLQFRRDVTQRMGPNGEVLAVRPYELLLLAKLAGRRLPVVVS